MALSLHVNGEASIWVDTGTSHALQELGVSVEGVTIDVKLHHEDVMVDTTGPGVPFDVQYFLEEAIINFDLVWYENDVWSRCMNRLYTTSAVAAGAMQAAGDLYVQNANTFRLLIKSNPASTGLTTVEPCWNFPKAYPLSSDVFTVGTRKTVHRMQWRALLNTLTLTGGAGTSTGLVLYNHTCT